LWKLFPPLSVLAVARSWLIPLKIFLSRRLTSNSRHFFLSEYLCCHPPGWQEFIPLMSSRSFFSRRSAFLGHAAFSVVRGGTYVPAPLVFFSLHFLVDTCFEICVILLFFSSMSCAVFFRVIVFFSSFLSPPPVVFFLTRRLNFWRYQPFSPLFGPTHPSQSSGPSRRRVYLFPG